MTLAMTVFLSGASIAFGLGEHMWFYMIARLLQGLAGACASVASTATLIAHSSDLTTDIGITEVSTGLGYFAGPALGALLYSHLGFRDMFLYSAIPPLIMTPLVIVIFRAYELRVRRRSSVSDPRSPGDDESVRWKVLTIIGKQPAPSHQG